MAKKYMEFLRLEALRLGAKDAKIINVSSVKTGDWVRCKCQFGCSGYGESLTCPPWSPAPDQTRKMLSGYKKAILIHCGSESLKDVSGIAVKLEREAFLAGFYKAFGMGAGPCNLCESCDVNERCKHPDEARPAMEACGIDVFKTARGNGFKIEVVNSTHTEGDYFGLVLLE